MPYTMYDWALDQFELHGLSAGEASDALQAMKGAEFYDVSWWGTESFGVAAVVKARVLLAVKRYAKDVLDAKEAS